MPSLNKVILIGHLGDDPEVKELDSGKKLAKLKLATNDGYGDNKKTNWHTVICWEKKADIVDRFAKKGHLLGVEGLVQYRTWEKDGDTKYFTEVIADKVHLMQPRDKNSNQSKPKNGNFDYGPPPMDDGDDVPF